jgi:hypothetical protein
MTVNYQHILGAMTVNEQFFAPGEAVSRGE